MDYKTANIHFTLRCSNRECQHNYKDSWERCHCTTQPDLMYRPRGDQPDRNAHLRCKTFKQKGK